MSEERLQENATLPRNQIGGEIMPVIKCPHCGDGANFRLGPFLLAVGGDEVVGLIRAINNRKDDR